MCLKREIEEGEGGGGIAVADHTLTLLCNGSSCASVTIGNARVRPMGATHFRVDDYEVFGLLTTTTASVEI